MKIHAYILTYNEEAILPFTLDYYSSFCDKIIVYDNESTDSSDEIFKRYKNVSVVKWKSDTINELNYLQIKNNAYKNSRKDNVDYVIVCDCDELLYHENLLEKLEEYKKEGITVPLIDGHDMVSEEFPSYDGDLITNKIKIGSKTYEPMCKNIIFNPDLDVQYGIGGHSFQAINAKYSKERELKLLHYKFLGKDYVKNIYISRAKRLSQFNKQNKFGEHYFNLPFQYMDTMLKEKYQVI